jgi:hypothetical protein
MRIGFWAVLCGFVVSISTTSSTLASCPDDAAAFAERVCGEISNRGSSQLITTSGELTAEAKGLVARMIGSAQGGANFNDTVQTYENVAREELAKDHANTRDCRAHMQTGDPGHEGRGLHRCLWRAGFRDSGSRD